MDPNLGSYISNDDIGKREVHLLKSHVLTFTLGRIMLLISYDCYNDIGGNVLKVNI